MEITTEEKKILEQIYGKFIFNSGYNPNQVEEVRELTDDEKHFFEKKNFISPHFCVQTLYKIKGAVFPLKFNRAVKNLIANDENFRANFCNVGTRALKVIFANRTIFPEIVFRSLSLAPETLDETLIKIMEADRRLDFDIQHGNLIRFLVFRTGYNEAAVLVTIAQLIFQRFNSESFFKAVLEETDYKKIEPKTVGLKTQQIENHVKEYWMNLLENLPVSPDIPFSRKLPGAYRAENYRAKIPADILSDLRDKSQKNRVLLMTILQTAWGFLLQATNKTSDVAFCQLTSNKKFEQTLSLNLVPVRLKTAKDLTIENIITQQFKQIVVSQPYSFFDWAAIENLSSRRVNLFGHFLSFVDFGGEEKTFSQIKAVPEGKIVERNSWDAQGMKLGVYFQYNNQELAISFQYDKKQFFQNTGERLANLYIYILSQILVFWYSPFEDFMKSIEKFINKVSEQVEQSEEVQRKFIIDCIYKNKILQGELGGVADILAEKSKISMYFEGDRISGDILNENLVFVVEGKLSRSLDTGDGWFNALDIVKGGGLLNETVLLPKRRATISAEVLTEKALLLTIPIETFESATRQNPALYKSILQHVLAQMEKYQVLWLQS